MATRRLRQAFPVALAVGLVAGAGAVVPTRAAEAATPATPALHYAFDETGGTALADDSGHGYDGTLAGTGGTLASGAVSLPGGASGSAAAYVSIPTTPFVGHKDITVSVWLKNATGAGNYAGAYVGNSATRNGYWLLNPSNPSGNVKSVLTRATTSVPNDAPWTTEDGPGNSNSPGSGQTATSHMALYTTVIDGTEATESFYLNGSLVQTNAISADLTSYGDASSLVAYLGKSPYADEFFSGQIDDYAVYQSALTGDQVADLFSAAPSAATKQAVTDAAAAGISLGDLSSVTENLTLPTSGPNGTTISWASNDPVIANTGVVTPDSSAHSVTLTATVSLSGVQSTRQFLAQVPAKVTTAAGAAAMLRLPYVLTAGTTLATTVGQANVTWSSSDQGLVTNAGDVLGTDTGLDAVTLTATVSLGADTATRAFHEKVAEKAPAYAASYVVTPNSMLNSSMHLALSGNGQTYQALNLGQGVLFAKADFDADSLNGVTKLMRDPYVFRMKDATFGVIATRTSNTGVADPKPILFTSPDLITYREVGLLDLNSPTAVTLPSAEYDAATDTYRVTWTGTDNANYFATTGDFSTFTAPALGDLNAADAPITGIANAATRDRIVLTRAEAKRLSDRFSQVTNTTVQAPTLSVPQGATPPTANDLGKATAGYSDGTANKVPVDWSSADLAAIDTSKPGTYHVGGTVKAADYAFPLVATPIADPDVFVYNGAYYMTGTTEDAGQKSLYMRKASTIAGLATATPQLIYGDTSVLSWAPEVHEINGSWYLNWATGTVWNQVKSTVVKLTGTDPANAADWDFAHAETVTLADGSAVQPSGITLDMTYFQSGDKWYAAWSDRVTAPTTGSANLKIASLDPNDPSKLTSAPATIARPDYGWDRNTSFVDEGPNVLQHDGKVVITFSGSGVNASYILGTLSASKGSDLLDPSSWTKENSPGLTSVNVPGQYGPGHNAYFTDLDGTLMTSFHAMNGASGARSTSVRAVQWGASGNLILDLVGSRQVLPANRTVSATVTVTPPSVPNKASSTVALHAAPAQTVATSDAGARITFTAAVTVADHSTATGAVVIKVAGKDHQVMLDAAGQARLTLQLMPGTYAATARYLGNDTIEASSTASASVVVRKRTSSLALTTTPKRPVTTNHKAARVKISLRVNAYTGTAPYGVALVKVGRKSYRVTVRQGLATVIVKLAKPKKYTVTAHYLGSSSIAASNTATARITIRKKG